MLTRLNDLSAASWIDEGRVPLIRNSGFAPVRVERLLPPIYPSYVKLFHRIWVDPSVADRAVSWPQAEEEGRYSEPDFDGAEHMSWRDLALRYGIVYHPEINRESFSSILPDGGWPRYLFGADEGTLDPETCGALITGLSRYSAEQPVYFYYGGLSVVGDDWPNPRLYKGVLQDVLLFEDMQEVSLSPEFWWPEDRAWCINTDYDLEFTIIGGPTNLLADLSAHSELELLPVTARSRVDYRSDQVNSAEQGTSD